MVVVLIGHTPHVYRHDLCALFQPDSMARKLSLRVNKVPAKFVPRQLAITTRIPETRNCLRCCVQHNPFNDYLYLCALVPNALILMQWLVLVFWNFRNQHFSRVCRYEPLHKFMVIKEHRCTRIQLPVRVFELLITPGKLYPVVCVGVRKGARRKHFALDQVGAEPVLDENISFQIDLNGPPDPPPSLSPDANELTLSKNENDKTSTNEQEILQPHLNVTALRQIARDVLLICIESWL